MKKQDERYVQNQCFIQFTREYCTIKNEPQLLMHSVINGVGISIPDTIPKAYHDKINQAVIYRYKALYEKKIANKELRVTVNKSNQIASVNSKDWKDTFTIK